MERGGLTIRLPGRREMRVTFGERQHAPADIAPDEGFSWIAYYDEGDGVARAVSPELSLVVERNTLPEAVAELEVLMRDYIADAAARGESTEEMMRLLPRDVIATHVDRLTKMLQRRREDFGTAWSAGHCQVGHATTLPAQAP
jgi:hypothetical protein